MNHSNVIVIISTIMLAVIFLVAVFFNLEIKKSKDELDELKEELVELQIEIKRKEIEIATLTSPKNVLDYIEKNNLKPVLLKNIDMILLKND